MANLLIIVDTLSVPGPYDAVALMGRVFVENVGPATGYSWAGYCAPGLTAQQCNDLCITAATNVAIANGHSVGPSDIKLMAGGVPPNVSALPTTAAMNTAIAAGDAATLASAIAASSASVVQPVAGTSVSPLPAMGAARMPNATRGTRVTVYGTWSWAITVLGTVSGTVSLQSDVNATPTTVRGLAPFSRGVLVGITVNETGTMPWCLTYDVPAGHSYRAVLTGAGTAAIVHLNETPL